MAVVQAKPRNGRSWGFGLVGCGMGAATHAGAFQAMANADAVAVFGRKREKAEAFRAKWGFRRAYNDFETFLGDPDLEIVVICTVTGTHRDCAIAAARAKKHVVLEKPFETTLARCLDVARSCRDMGVLLSGIYQMRFTTAAQRIKAAIDAGELGEIIHVNIIDMEWRGPEYYEGHHAWCRNLAASGGGVFTTNSIHMLDYAQFFTHKACGLVRKVYAQCRTSPAHSALEDFEVEDLAMCTLTCESGATCTILAGTCSQPAFKHRVEVHGTKGTMMCNGHRDKLILSNVLAGATAEVVDHFKDGDFEVLDTPDPHQFPNVPRHARNLEDVLTALENGRLPVVHTACALRTELIRAACYKSSELGVPLLLDQSDIDLDSSDGVHLQTYKNTVTPGATAVQGTASKKREAAAVEEEDRATKLPRSRQETEHRCLGFIGVGAIGGGIVRGLLSSGSKALIGKVVVCDVDIASAESLRSSFPCSVEVLTSDQAVVDAADWVFVALGNFGPKARSKQAITAVLDALHFREEQTVVSLSQTVPYAELLPLLAPVRATSIVKALPIPDPEDRISTTAVHPTHAEVERLFSHLGEVVALESEALLVPCFATTALMGNFFKQLEAAAVWLESQGMDPASAARYVASAHLSFAQKAAVRVRGQEDASALSALVAGLTPGGINVQVVGEMAKRGVYEQVPTSLDSALARISAQMAGMVPGTPSKPVQRSA